MIVHDCIQRSEQWHALRAGIPTASNFYRIVTPEGKRSDQAEHYMMYLLAEWAMGHAILDKTFHNEHMDRGEALEEEAVASFECDRGIDTQVVGFVTNEAGTIGCSPDRFAGDKEGVEIKCPAPQTHMRYMLTMGPEKKYTPQLQGSLWLCERDKWSISSYCPGLPSLIIPVARDEKYIALLSAHLNTFVDVMLEARLKLTERYGEFKPPAAKVEDANPFGIGAHEADAMVEAIWAASHSREAV